LNWPGDFINKIICGDCLEVMKHIPDRAVDLILTDPQYGVGQSSGTIGKSRSHKIRYETTEDSPQYVRSVCVPAFVESLIKANGRGILTPGPINLCEYPNPDSFGVMYQPATCGMQKWGRADSQPIFFYGRDPRVGLTIQPCSYTVTERPSCPQHPCSKPIRFWSKLVMRGSLESDIILDPFCGSGTTCVAAKQLGRKYIGIEINESYCKIAEDRLRQGELFNVGAGQ